MSKRILLCDDEIHIIKAAEIKFRRAGFDVRCASDGQMAWETMQEWLPDILVTDCQMPRLNGIELCQRCRECVTTNSLPIVMLTAKGYELPREELCREYGLTAILPKPFSPRELVHTVERILEQSCAATCSTGVLPTLGECDTNGMPLASCTT
ncbi:MAG: response regulator [Planctomycetes bacterium]|nr:response regulator [Planctomycetota bacterium]